MKKINREIAQHYNFKEICDGWHLLKRDDLSIISEKMPPNTFEDRHYHVHARQFFYILKGQATMKFIDHTEILNVNDGIEIEPGELHQMSNESNEEIEFLVISTPKSHGDKVVV